MVSYHSGEMDQLITIKRPTRTADGVGGYTRSPTTIATCWAKVRRASGGESQDRGQVSATSLYIFIIYYRTDISEGDYIEWDSETYNIRGIGKTSGRRIFMEVSAEKGVAP